MTNTKSLSMILVASLNGTPIWNHGQLFSVNEPECHVKSVSKNSSRATSPTTQSPKHIPKYSAKPCSKFFKIQIGIQAPQKWEISKYMPNSNHTSPSTSHIFIPWFSTFLSWQNHILTTPNDRRSKKKTSGIISVTTVRIVMKLRSHNLGMLPHGIQDTVDGRNPASVEVGSLSYHLQCFLKIPGGARFLPSTESFKRRGITRFWFSPWWLILCW